MARRRRTGQETGVSLFSFLNIMAATIGVQSLLILIFALQIKPGVQAIRLLPAGGEGQGKQAHYILCNGDGELELISTAQRESIQLSDPKLDTFLDRMATASPAQYLVIGVRPSAFRDFERVRSKAEARKITLGYEPLEAGLKVTVPGANPVNAAAVTP